MRKVFDAQSWSALLSLLGRIKKAADDNSSAVSGLGEDLVEMGRKTSAALEKMEQDISGAVSVSVGAEPPDNTKLLWIDTAEDGTGGLKYHNGTAWAAVPVLWG